MSQGDIRKPHLQQFYRNQQGRDYIEYPGLLAEFHAQNDAWMLKHPDEQDHRSIQSVIVQVPHVDNGNIAICTATVRMSSGATFTDVADASPNNVSKMLVNALLRMSSTRCKGRALRDATNIGTTMYEELPDAEPTEQDEGEPAHAELTEQPTRASNYTPTNVHHPRPARQAAESDSPRPAQQHTGGRPALDSQLKAIRDLSRQAGTPEDPQPGDYNFQLAGARIQELQSATRQGGQQ